MMMSATTGMVRTSVDAIHQIEFSSFRIRPLSPMIAAAIAENPLIRDISRAIRPRVRQPNSSTGDSATIKNKTVTIEGINRCRVTRLIV